MKKIYLTFLCFAFGACSAISADTVTFKTADDLASVLDNPEGASLSGVKGPGTAFLDLRGASQTYTLKRSFKAKENTKYLLTLNYGVGGRDVVEKNDRVPEMQTQSSNLLPGWKTMFFDAKGKLISMRNYRGMTFTHEFGTEKDVFYTPAGTTEVRIAFYLPKNESELVIRAVKFAVAPDEGALNCNPVFKYGYPGWNGFLRGSLLFQDPDGMVLDSAYGTGGEVFPLKGPGRYTLSARGKSFGGYRVVNFEQLDLAGKVIKTVSVTATPEGVSTEFSLEPNAVRGRFNVYNHLLREVRLVRVK